MSEKLIEDVYLYTDDERPCPLPKRLTIRDLVQSVVTNSQGSPHDLRRLTLPELLLYFKPSEDEPAADYFDRWSKLTGRQRYEMAVDKFRLL